MKKRSVIIGIIIIDIVVVVVLAAIALINASKTAVMDVVLVPKTAVLRIENDEFRQGVYKMFPGKVSGVISAEGFEDKIIEIDLNSETTTKVYEYLIPIAENKTYYAKNQDDFDAMKKIGGEEAQKISNLISIREVLPIIKYEYAGLTGESREIIINQDLTCDDYYCLGVTGVTEEEKDIVEAMIKDRGYNPEDYIINYEK